MVTSIERMREVLHEAPEGRLTPEQRRLIAKGHLDWLDAVQVRDLERRAKILKPYLRDVQYSQGRQPAASGWAELRSALVPSGPTATGPGGGVDRVEQRVEPHCYDISPILFDLETEFLAVPPPTAGLLDWVRFSRANASDRTLEVATVTGGVPKKGGGSTLYPPTGIGDSPGFFNVSSASIGEVKWIPPHGLHHVLEVVVALRIEQPNNPDITAADLLFAQVTSNLFASAELEASLSVHGAAGSARVERTIGYESLFRPPGAELIKEEFAPSVVFLKATVGLLPSSEATTLSINVSATSRASILTDETDVSLMPYAISQCIVGDVVPFSGSARLCVVHATASLCSPLPLKDEEGPLTPPSRPV